MDLWLDLIFGNPVGLFSIITVLATIGIVGFILTMLFRKSHDA